MSVCLWCVYLFHIRDYLLIPIHDYKTYWVVKTDKKKIDTSQGGVIRAETLIMKEMERKRCEHAVLK